MQRFFENTSLKHTNKQTDEQRDRWASWAAVAAKKTMGQWDLPLGWCGKSLKIWTKLLGKSLKIWTKLTMLNFFIFLCASCKVHVLQSALVANCMHCKVHMLQSSHVAKYKICKVNVLQSARVEKCTCFKVHLLQSSLVAKCTCCKVHVLQSTHVAKLPYCKVNLLQSTYFSKCTCCKVHMLQSKGNIWKLNSGNLSNLKRKIYQSKIIQEISQIRKSLNCRKRAI